MSNSDKRLIYSFMRNLSKNQLHELKEFFPVGIWNNKSNAERRTLGRKFKQAVRECQFKRITSFEVKSNRHTYYLSLNEKSPNVIMSVRRFLFTLL